MDRHTKALEILHNGTVIPAIPLVLNEKRKFNEQGQRTLIRYYLHAGVGGLAIAVHTTQFEIRDPNIGLFEPILKIAAEEIDAFEKESGKTIVHVAGACGPSPQAVREAGIARDLGFDAVLLSPGGLNSLTEKELIERTKLVATVMPVIGFYLQTAVGGRYLPFEYWKAVADIDNVVAFKAAPFDRYKTLDLVRGCAFSDRSDKVALYTGNDDNIVIDLLTKYEFEVNGKTVRKRFVGGLLGHWSLWTYNVVRMFEMLKSHCNDECIPSELLTLAAQVTDCNGAFFDVANNFKGCIAGVHEVLRRQGLIEGIWCLNPNETLSPGQKEEIDRVCRMYPHLNDDEFVKKNIASWK
ncbi:MAG: dihydrodipicolinate synthase family protein [Clostridia bacterium]